MVTRHVEKHSAFGVTTDNAEKRAAELGRALPPQFDAWFQ